MFSLFGCGGGSVSVSNHRNADKHIPPEMLIQRLATEPADKVEALLAETHQRGDDLNWASFWEQLTRHAQRDRLIKEHYQSLLSLQEKDCSSTAFDSYLHFVTEAKAGLEYGLPPLRTCDATVKPATAMRFFSTYVQSKRPKAPTQDEALSLARFLSHQLSSNRAGEWNAAVSSVDRDLLNDLANGLLKAGAVEETVDLASNYQNALGDLPFAEVLQRRFLDHTPLLKAFVERRGQESAVQVLSQLSVANPAMHATFEAQPTQNFFTVLLTNPYGWAKDDGKRAWVHYSRLKTLIVDLTQNWPIVERMEIVEKSQAAYEQWLLAQSAEQREAYLMQAAMPLENHSLSLDAAWFIHRLLPATHELRKWAQPRLELAQAGDTRATDATDRILSARLKTYYAADATAAKAARLAFCEAMEAEGASAGEISALDLKEALQNGIRPGCYRLTDITNHAVAIQATQALSASTDSSIEAWDTALKIEAPTVELGMIDLSTTTQPLPQAPVPVPNERHSVAFPLVVQLIVKTPSRTIPSGTHFLVLHHVQKQADPGQKNPVAAVKGYPGRALTIVTDNSPRPFTFISEGGPGQKASPPQPGGRGDSSLVNTAELREWISELEALNPDPQFVLPFILDEQLTQENISDLINLASIDPNFQVKTFINRNFLRHLPPDQVSKIKAVAGQSEEAKIYDYVTKTLAPLALQTIDAEARAQRRAGALAAADLVSAANPNREFLTNAAASGPINPDGARGDQGPLSVQTKGKAR